MEKISFEYIKSLFDETVWDIGYLSKENLQRVSHSPIKEISHPFGDNYTNKLHLLYLSNALVFIRDGHTWDYTHYEQVVDILRKNNVKNWKPIYVNFKEAAIISGLGVRAKNSLIYSYKFGFDCHIAAVKFDDEIVDLPTNKRINYKIWNRCIGCDDCAKACPVGAIQNKGEPFSWWLNSDKCDDFITTGDHERIPSIKTFWHKNVYPEISKHIIDQMKDAISSFNIFRSLGFSSSFPFNKNGYSFDGQVVKKQGKAVNVPFCRECTSQPRCSKWNGKYPYDRIFDQEEISIIDLAKGERN